MSGFSFFCGKSEQWLLRGMSLGPCPGPPAAVGPSGPWQGLQAQPPSWLSWVDSSCLLSPLCFSLSGHPSWVYELTPSIGQTPPPKTAGTCTSQLLIMAGLPRMSGQLAAYLGCGWRGEGGGGGGVLHIGMHLLDVD